MNIIISISRSASSKPDLYMCEMVFISKYFVPNWVHVLGPIGKIRQVNFGFNYVLEGCFSFLLGCFKFCHTTSYMGLDLPSPPVLPEVKQGSNSITTLGTCIMILKFQLSDGKLFQRLIILGAHNLKYYFDLNNIKRRNAFE